MARADESAVDDFVIKLQKLLENHDLKGLQSLVENADDRDLWARGVWPIFDALGPFLKYVKTMSRLIRRNVAT